MLQMIYRPITKSFNLVAKVGFLASWTINIIQMSFKYDERCSLGNYKIIMLGKVFGKLYGFVVENS